MPDDFLSRLEYDPAAPDVESIMRQVREYLRARGDAPEPVARGTAPVAGRALDELRQAEAEVAGLQLAPYVAPSGTPVVGRLLDRVRLEFHRLVVYYVGRFADAQARFNGRAVTAIEGLAAGAGRDDAAARMGRLEAQVASLEARLRALESGEAGAATDTK